MSSTPGSRTSIPQRTRTATPRASERVMEYLLAEMDRPGVKAGCRLPAIRDLSAQLNVSPPTVHGVLQQLVKQGLVRTVAGRGSFFVSPRPATDGFNLALSMPLPRGQAGHYWSHRVAAAIVIAVCQSDRKIKLVPLPPHVNEVASNRALLAERSEVDGLILIPQLDDAEIRQAYESAGKPVVDANPPANTATSNFVSTDYCGASCRLARVWRETGRTRVVFLGSNLATASSEQLRFSGFALGLQAHVEPRISFQVIETSLTNEGAAIQALRPLLADRASAPDAIYCAGDHLALDVVCAAREAGLRVPEDISIVGATGLDLSDSICPQLTRLEQPFEQLGRELVSLICDRIALKGRSLPGKFIPTGFMGGGTTRSEENVNLGMRLKL